MSEEEIETLADEAWEGVATIGDDTEKLSKEESADFYELIADHASSAARALREELRNQ